MRPDTLDTGPALDAADDHERFRELFQSLEVGVVVHAADGTIVSCNPAAESILELSPDQPPAAIREQAGQVRAAGRHLLAVVTDLLDAARLDAGAAVVETAPTPLEPLLDPVHAMMTAEAAAAGIGLWHEPAPGLTAIADATRLRQALCNLVSYGIRHNRAGGRGIAAEDLERIFEPFQRLPGEAALGGVEGTGPGLTICRGVVERMDGRITVRSRPGAGSVFSVFLKAAPAG